MKCEVAGCKATATVEVTDTAHRIWQVCRCHYEGKHFGATIGVKIAEGKWGGSAAGEEILADIKEMIKALQRDRKYGPYVMYLPDEAIRRMGGNPEDYPTLEGYPNVRVVTAR
jgi:hypothetical protein